MITKDMTILEIAEKYPGSLEVFKIYDERFQTCICCNSLFDTLEQVCSKYGIDLEEILSKINT
ncbi:MAG: DUF1858 domain-containing protein [Clostridiales bacterium]|nr:DUF1858 domain-containing protein [Clostridiales bacterium]MCF8021794.1 DUF1858 domain-containing protein [Clostridiales bacterium]